MMIKEKRQKVEFIESYIKWGNSDYQWNDNHGELIRCKDCKYAHITYDGDIKYCDRWFPDEAEYLDGDYYCASAERKENDE